MENVIIVAHPDDEAIWFSSILKRPDTALFICFQNKYPENLKENSRYANKVFEVLEFYKGILPVVWLQTIKTTKPRVFGKVDPATEKHLEYNLHSVIQITCPEKVYTHNPFGEYGHSEHILIHKTLKKFIRSKLVFPNFLKQEIGFEGKEKTLDSLVAVEKNSVDIHFRNILFGLYKEKGIWTGAKGEPYGRTERFLKYK